MKCIKFIVPCVLLYCCFSCEGVADMMYVRNDSSEAIYVYFTCGNTDSLPYNPKLELFHFSSADMKDANGNSIEPRFSSPDYRINAYDVGVLKGGLQGRIMGVRKKMQVPCDDNEITLFIITEATMRNNSWSEIHKDQLYVKKVLLTLEELEINNWLYTYES